MPKYTESGKTAQESRDDKQPLIHIVFLLRCLDATNVKPSMQTIGESFGLSKDAARKRFDRIRKRYQELCDLVDNEGFASIPDDFVAYHKTADEPDTQPDCEPAEESNDDADHEVPSSRSHSINAMARSKSTPQRAGSRSSSRLKAKTKAPATTVDKVMTDGKAKTAGVAEQAVIVLSDDDAPKTPKPMKSSSGKRTSTELADITASSAPKKMKKSSAQQDEGPQGASHIDGGDGRVYVTTQEDFEAAQTLLLLAYHPVRFGA